MQNSAVLDRQLTLPKTLIALSLLTAVAMAYGVYLIFFFAPIEAQMGWVQKIFYFHVPCAWNLFLSVAVACLGSVLFLTRRQDRWDRLGEAGTELAILFGTLVLMSGPLWGRKAWGAYWVWDVRLTSTLVLVLTMVAAKIVRGYAGPSARQIAAGLTVFAVLNSIFVYYSVDIWRGTHPPKVVQNKLEPDMAKVFWFCVATFLVGFVVLLWLRLRMGVLKSAVDRLHMLATEAGIHD
ncbi:MAG: cytochrome c biogenesis protein CcsA [Myxococcota bacterium]